MAQLNPKDPQFGIPVATRIRQELAFNLNKEATKANKTLSRYVAEFLERGEVREKKITELSAQLTKEKETISAQEKKINELQQQLAKEKEIMKKAVGIFIVEIAEGEEEYVTQLVQTYNTILKNEKSK